MNRRSLPLSLAFAALLAAGGASLAPAGDEPDGKTLFRQYCKGCHGPKAKAGEYTPMTLIGDQWTRFFDKKFVPTHRGIADPAHGDQPVPEAIPPADLEKIRRFAIDHAADSEHPMTCG